MYPSLFPNARVCTLLLPENSLSSKFSNWVYPIVGRDILRTSKHFYWCNEDGEQWSIILRQSARKEFESARDERDPLIIAKLLVVGQSALMQAQQKVDSLKFEMTRKVEETRNR